jgi:hypothetical protein
MLVGVLLYLATIAVARVTPLSCGFAAKAAGAIPETKRAAAPIKATAVVNLRIDTLFH